MWTTDIDLVTPVVVALPGARSAAGLGSGDAVRDSAVALQGAGLRVPPILVSAGTARDKVARSLADMDPEPAGLILSHRPLDAAPTALLGALFAKTYGLGRQLLLVPENPLLPEGQVLHRALAHALPAAQNGTVVAIGIEASAATAMADAPPHGLIRVGHALAIGTAGAGENLGVLERFVRSAAAVSGPEGERSPRLVWNSGMLLFDTESLIEMFRRERPDYHAAALAAFAYGGASQRRVELDAGRLDALPALSLDEVILAGSGSAAVVVAEARRDGGCDARRCPMEMDARAGTAVA